MKFASAFFLALVAFVAQVGAQSAAPQPSPTPRRNSPRHGVQHRTKKKQRPVRHAPIKIRRAFVASSSLRPMAQQLIANRTPVAYAAVQNYAAGHPGESAALAWLAVGYAHSLDQNCAAAVSDYWKAKKITTILGDYLDFFAAQCYQQLKQPDRVRFLLSDFDKKYPESSLSRSAAVMLAQAETALGNTQQAIAIYEQHREPVRADLEFGLAQAYDRAGQTEKANAIFQHLYLTFPLSDQADVAKQELQKNGITPASLQLQARRARADLLFGGHRYADAAEEYRALLPDPAAQNMQQALWVSLGACYYQLKRMNDATDAFNRAKDATGDDGARRLYLLMEMARDHDDGEEQRRLVEQLKSGFTTSPWLEEALLSSYNMYLLRKDFEHAIGYATDLFHIFPRGKRAAYLHWKAAWLSLRMGNTADAGRLFDEQIGMYPASAEAPAALYWRGRLLEEQNDPARAKAYYEKLDSAFLHYYYADLARERLAKLAAVTSTRIELLDRVTAPSKPVIPEVPDDELHVARARLLANAGLTEVAAAEIMSQGDTHWAAFAVSDLYVSIGLDYRGLQTLKRALPGYYSLDVKDLPRKYWNILFPQSYWNDIQRYASENGLDSLLVASLIRQESEFNPGAVSRANAYGLMQLLPTVGKGMARELKLRRYDTSLLLDPTTNIQLGTRYFRKLSDQFGGSVAYALASYNAGTDRVDNWQKDGKYRDIYEFIESIPFTETREYVQAIMRNASIYRELYVNAVAVNGPAEAKQ